jgi:hypothetical protein
VSSHHGKGCAWMVMEAPLALCSTMRTDHTTFLVNFTCAGLIPSESNILAPSSTHHILLTDLYFTTSLSFPSFKAQVFLP